MSMDVYDEIENEVQVNFIPCLKFVRRGVARATPEKVKLTPDELAAVIGKTKDALQEGNNDEEEGVITEENSSTAVAANDEEDLEKKYDMGNYDEEEGNDLALAISNLVVHADPKEDPYLVNPEEDDDESDVEDFLIKPTDNLILVGHVEGDASILEVYVYNDVEDALYVHHDLLLPSFPLALEWLSYEPGESIKGNLVAVGTMNPVIEVWDLDIVNCLEPAFNLGRKGSKKKKIKPIGHTKAVLSLAWNHHVEHVLASGSVDETVLLWDLSEGSIASKISAHMEKVQALQWHPFEAQSLLTGCCDNYARVFDCRANDACKSWKVEGEVEKVLWNHFDPFTFFVGTDSGHVHLIDVRKDDAPVWTLKAHSESVNGIGLSTQCPDCVITVSSDKALKIWDISENKPRFVHEQNVNLGQLHTLDTCPDAPFVVAIGGDKPSDNLKVFDIRQSAPVRKHFGSRELKNPLGTTEFGFKTADEAEPEKTKMDVSTDVSVVVVDSGHSVSGGAAGKFKKKKKKNKEGKKK